MTSDQRDTQMLANIRNQHVEKIRQNAERIAEQAGYILNRIEAGKTESSGLHARGIVSDAQEITIRLGILEGMTDAAGILDHEDS